MTMTIGDLLDLIGFSKNKVAMLGVDLNKKITKEQEERILREVDKD